MAKPQVQNAPNHNKSSLDQGRQGTLLSTNFTMVALSTGSMSKVITEMYAEEGVTSTLLMRAKESNEVIGTKSHCWMVFHKPTSFFYIDGTYGDNNIQNGSDNTVIVPWSNSYPVYRKDVAYLPSGKAGFVKSVSDTQIVFEGYGSTITSADFIPADITGKEDTKIKLTILYNMQEECFTPEGGMNFTPDKMCATFTKISRKFNVCDEVFGADQTIVELPGGHGHYWYYKQDQEYRNHKREIDNVILEGRESGVMSTGGQGGAGIIPLIKARGLVASTAAYDEEFWMEYTKRLKKSSIYKKFLVIAGTNVIAETTVALKSYIENGAVSYGTFKVGKGQGICVGLNIECYYFNGIHLTFVEEEKFSDETTYPINPGFPSMEDSAVVLGIGLEKGTRKESMEVVFRTYTHPGSKTTSKSKMHIKTITGNVINGSTTAAHDQACHTEIITSELMVLMRTPEYHGFVYKAAA